MSSEIPDDIAKAINGLLEVQREAAKQEAKEGSCTEWMAGRVKARTNALRDAIYPLATDAAKHRAAQAVGVDNVNLLLSDYGIYVARMDHNICDTREHHKTFQKADELRNQILNAFRALTAELEAAKATNAELRFHLSELLIDVTNATTESEKSDALSEAQRFLERIK